MLRYELEELDDELRLEELDERNDDERFDELDDDERTLVDEPLLLDDEELTVEPRRDDVEPPPDTELPFDDDELLPSAELTLNELLRLVDVDEPRKLPAELWLLFDDELDEPTVIPVLTLASLTLLRLLDDEPTVIFVPLPVDAPTVELLPL